MMQPGLFEFTVHSATHMVRTGQVYLALAKSGFWARPATPEEGFAGRQKGGYLGEEGRGSRGGLGRQAKAAYEAHAPPQLDWF